MPRLERIHTTNAELQRLQDSLFTGLVTIVRNPIVDGVHLTGTALAGITLAKNRAVTEVEHKLGRRPLGYLISRKRCAATGADGSVQAPTFQNSWVDDTTGSRQTAGYYIDGQGFVHLRGSIKNGFLSTPAFTLPAGFRPSAVLDFPGYANGAYGAIQVASSGDVTPTIGATTTVSLNGVSFRAVDAQSASAEVWDEQDENTSPERTLRLVASAGCVVDLYVF